MKRRNVIVLALCLTAFVCALAQQVRVSSPSTNSGSETKVSETRTNGQYKRTTETFAAKVLVARRVEVSLKDNGQIDHVFIKLFRDGKMTFASTFNKPAKNTIRSYYHDGKMAVSEGDEDGDGFFETMILFDAKEQPVEAFSKSKDGTVTQFSKEKLVELKKSFAKLQE